MRPTCCAPSRPWLTEARDTREVSLRHGPQGAAEVNQRSCLVAPLVVQNRVTGFIYADIDGAFGRFGEIDRDLLAMLAGQAAVALDNAQWAQGLERKVADRTRDLSESLERQTATADILRVISQSPNDAHPVFDAIAKSAYRLLSSSFAVVLLRKGDTFYRVSAYSADKPEGQPPSDDYIPIDPAANFPSRVFVSGQTLHLPDWTAIELPPHEQRQFERGTHSSLMLPLLVNGDCVGVLAVGRHTVQPFAPAEIGLLQAFVDQAVIAIENVRLFNETNEALERQTATAEILKVIAESPSDVQPVFDIIGERAARLTGADYALVCNYDGEWIHVASSFGVDAGGINELRTAYPVRPSSATITARAVRDAAVAQEADVLALADGDYPSKNVARRVGFRSVLSVPMLRDGRPVGAISVMHPRTGAFAAHEVDLLQTFADQAVIAIENVRLFNETQEALERQTATAEVLQVISSSVTDTQPVFDAIVQSCQRLFGGKAVSLVMPRGEMCESVAYMNDSAGEGVSENLKPWPLDRGSGAGACILEARVINVADTFESRKEFARMPDLAIALGYRSCLFVPLMRDGAALGCLAILRAATGAFDDKEVALARSFASQAVIAIQNARMFDELEARNRDVTEALDQQQASAEILNVISQSVENTQPVFDKILQSCKMLFGGDELDVLLVDEQGQLTIGAYLGKAHDIVAATFPAPVEKTPAGRAIRERRVVHWPDLVNGEDVPGVLRKMAKQIGYTSMAFAPMLWEQRGIGAIGVARSTGAFKPKELSLLQTFADQAVIAIQNAKMFRETKEALERQTATADILAVISESPTDVGPVFQAIAERARVLCQADIGATTRLEGGMVHLAGVRSETPQAEEAMRSRFPTPLDEAAPNIRRAIVEQVPVQIADVRMEPGYTLAEDAQDKMGFVSIMSVPLLHEGRAIGTIGVARRAPGLFADTAVALLQIFARQAVIAIENVRLFNETREALERQTATANVLKAISRTTFDLAAVLEVLIGTAARLCGASLGVIFRVDGDLCLASGLFGATPALIEHLAAHPPRLSLRDGITAAAAATGHPVQVEDAATDSRYGRPDVQRVGGYRTLLAVPILREADVIGVLTLGRTEAHAFDAKEIEIVTSFADQAAIAMENVRLFNETKQALHKVEERTTELSESLEYQTAISEVLRVISESPTDVAPVFEVIMDCGMRLFQPKNMAIMRTDGRLIHVAATRNWSAEAIAQAAQVYPLPVDEHSLAGRVILARQTIAVEDTQDDRAYALAPLARTGGWRRMVAAPMLKDGVPMGTIHVAWPDAGQTPQRQIELLQTFADQAVIALENVRLLNETREALEQQKASAEVLSVISNSVSDSSPVFEAIVQSCQKLFGSDSAIISLVSEDGIVRHEAIAVTRQSHMTGRRSDALSRPRLPATAGRGLPELPDPQAPTGALPRHGQWARCARGDARVGARGGQLLDVDRAAAVGGPGHRHHPRRALPAAALHREGVRACCAASPTRP